MEKCCWCTKTGVNLIPHKKYCYVCKDNMFRECKRCKRPLDSKKYFENSDVRCNSCQKKYLYEKNSRLKKLDQQKINEENQSKKRKRDFSSEDETSKSGDESDTLDLGNLKCAETIPPVKTDNTKKIKLNEVSKNTSISKMPEKCVFGYIVLNPDILENKISQSENKIQNMDNGEDFHILLASNTKNSIKDNKPSDFSIPLPKALNLKGYEVGVAQISYPCSLSNITDEDCQISFVLETTDEAGETIANTLSFEIPPGQYDDINSLTARLNFQTLETGIIFKYVPALEYVMLKITVEKDSRFILNMSSRLLTILGFQDLKIFNVHNYTSKKALPKSNVSYTYDGSHHPEPYGHSFCFFVYSNVVKPLMVSDSYAPLIFYSTYNSKQGEYNHERIKEILYRPVDVNFIQEIGIEIRDSLGFLIDFQWGNVYILLHFKKIKE